MPRRGQKSCLGGGDRLGGAVQNNSFPPGLFYFCAPDDHLNTYSLHSLHSLALLHYFINLQFESLHWQLVDFIQLHNIVSERTGMSDWNERECVCVCVWERERERERDHVKVGLREGLMNRNGLEDLFWKRNLSLQLYDPLCPPVVGQLVGLPVHDFKLLSPCSYRRTCYYDLNE